MAADNQREEVLVIEAGKSELHYWRDIWRYRELLFFLAWRDFLVRYKQAVLGVAWSVIRPVMVMAIFTVVFSKLAKLPSNNIPYPILVFSAMIPWQFFANALSETSNSLITNASIITKVYFPRIIIPGSSLIVNLVDLAISLAILAILMIWYRFSPPYTIIFLPAFIGLAFLCALGTGLWLTCLNVKYRDFRYIVPFILQFGLYISPVGFSSVIIPEKWYILYSLNPLVGIIEGCRWSITANTTALFMPSVILAITTTFIIFISGVWYFRKTERNFADVI